MSEKNLEYVMIKEDIFQDFSNITENITDTIYDYFKVIMNKATELRPLMFVFDLTLKAAIIRDTTVV